MQEDQPLTYTYRHKLPTSTKMGNQPKLYNKATNFTDTNREIEIKIEPLSIPTKRIAEQPGNKDRRGYRNQMEAEERAHRRPAPEVGARVLGLGRWGRGFLRW